jgi:hypothetical protein
MRTDMLKRYILIIGVGAFFISMGFYIFKFYENKKSKKLSGSAVDIINFIEESDRKDCLENEKLVNARYIIHVNGKSGFIDGCGVVRIPPRYDSVLEFSEGLARVKKNGKYGYVNKNGDTVSLFLYDDAMFFKEGLAAVKIDTDWGERWGFINKNDEHIIYPRYFSAYSFNNGLALVYDGKKVKAVDAQNKSVFQFNTTDVGFNITKDVSISTVLERSTIIGENRLYDYSGQQIRAPRQDKTLFCEGKAVYIDFDKKQINILNEKEELNTIKGYRVASKPSCFSHNHSQEELLKNNYIIIEDDYSKKGVLNLDGIFVLDVKYEDVKILHGVGFAVKENGLWQLHNKKGERSGQEYYNFIVSCDGKYISTQLNRNDKKQILKNDFTIVAEGDLISKCPSRDRILFQKGEKVYFQNMADNKRIILPEKYSEYVNSKVAGKGVNIFDGMLLVRGLYFDSDLNKEKSFLEIIDVDSGLDSILLRVNPAGHITLHKTADGEIIVLKWNGNTYYLNKDYKVFWSEISS